MAKVWVRAKTVLNDFDAGKLITRHPGDWFKTGKQQARNWLANGQIEIINPETIRMVMPPSCGIVSPVNTISNGAIPVIVSDYPVFEYDRILFYNPSIFLKKEFIPAAFKLLDNWEVIVPIADYNRLACDVGTEEDRSRTKEIIHDLRVPVYETRAMFLRKAIATEELLEVWKEERSLGESEELAFLRALYRVKPYILALPSLWVDSERR